MHLRVAHPGFLKMFFKNVQKDNLRGETIQITIPFVVFGSPLDSRSYRHCILKGPFGLIKGHPSGSYTA